MRTVFSNSEVAHVWAQQCQESGRNAGDTFFFENKTIYSWGRGLPIAEYKIMPNGKAVIMFDDYNYSNSTCKHQDHTIQAIRGNGYRVIYMPSETWDNYEKGVKYLVEQIQDKMDRCSRARENAKWLLRDCAGYISRLHSWGKLHNEHPTYKFSDVEKAAVVRAHEMKAKLAKRDRERMLAQHRKTEREITDLKDLCGGDVNAYWRKFGKIPSGFSTYSHLKDTLCRVVKDEVVTSRGAKVPISHAIRLLRIVKKYRDSGKQYIAHPSHPIHCGYYTLDSVNHNGDIKIGCHTIKWDEVDILGRQLLPEVFGV